MSHYESLLQTIIENPDDLECRLVLADWLEEQQSSHAEYIRISCRLETESDQAIRKELQRIANDLLVTQQHRWNAQIHRILARTPIRKKSRGGEIRSWRYGRGCFEHVSITCDAFKNHLDSVLQIGPINSLDIVNESRTTQDGGFVDMFVNNDRLLRIRRLQLRSFPCPNMRWRELVQAESLKNLVYLRIAKWSLAESGFGFGEYDKSQSRWVRKENYSRQASINFRDHWESKAKAVFDTAGPSLQFLEMECCMGAGSGSLLLLFRKESDGKVIVTYKGKPLAKNIR